MYSINSEVSSKSNVRPTIEGNRIVTMTFDGIESKTIESKKDSSKWDILIVKFTSDEGNFEDTIFEPKAEDAKRKTNPELGYVSPSNVEELMAKFRHLIAAVNPELDAQIEKKEKTLSAANWKALCTLMEKATNKGKGKEVQLKLINDKDGKPQFPRFFLGLSKADKTYLKTNFIASPGAILSFTDKEKERMATVASAKVTPMAKSEIKGLDNDLVGDTNTSGEGDGLDFDLEDL